VAVDPEIGDGEPMQKEDASATREKWLQDRQAGIGRDGRKEQLLKNVKPLNEGDITLVSKLRIRGNDICTAQRSIGRAMVEMCQDIGRVQC
jgi:hypothetical protein